MPFSTSRVTVLPQYTEGLVGGGSLRFRNVFRVLWFCLKMNEPPKVHQRMARILGTRVVKRRLHAAVAEAEIAE